MILADAGQFEGKEKAVHPPGVGATVADIEGDGPGQPHRSFGMGTVTLDFPLPLSLPE